METEDLHGHEGHSVRIHPAAWKGIGTLLKSVNVKGVYGKLGEDIEMSPSEPTVVPQRITVTETLALSSNAQSRTAERTHTTPRPIPLTPSSSSLSLKTIAPKSARKRSSPSKKREREEALHDEDEDEDERPMSPRKARLARPRIMSDYHEEAFVERSEKDGSADSEAELSEAHEHPASLNMQFNHVKPISSQQSQNGGGQ